jgi:hypothetical protein
MSLPNQKVGHLGITRKIFRTLGNFLLKTGQSLEKQDEWELYIRLKSSKL